jgi:hypothetical protein
MMWARSIDSVEVCPQPRLGLGSGEKDIVADDPRSGSSHGSNARRPGGGDLTESFSDGHLTVFAEGHAGGGVHQ